MDNYKIKVNDEAESKEAQELLKQLGFQEEGFTGIGLPCYLATWDGGYADYYFGSLSEGRKREELTLPQLRDLVVLKRNDVKDATHEDQYGDKWLYLDERHYVYLNDQWDLPIGEFLERYELKPILPVKKQDPALISGAEAKLAWAKGEIVEYFRKSRDEWFEVKGNTFVSVFDTAEKLRIKPQTIKLELEIPAPYKAKIGGRDDTSFVLNVGRHQYCYKTEEEYTKARDALEAVFDSAVRGTNS
ncbi:hypothetical protein ORU28_13875 [Acinetobacter baumannii]|uniref:hypothetical protein n=1 Tax=Acinetobacter baumannii TaxID=470 RepID=UPI00070EE93F|nr:hypothetical protein [Acinetobacter baumannii]KRI04212.1 hypothetical protein APC63_14290 [Acinetobacter baumannii]KRI11842.1 hypothetical protein APC85_04625 [Acinetobacter baumannii]KRI74724.1 hypothetical protein APC65_12280 [Acinetobacter baumannii]MDA5578549.1 hypothetical protein [Acinetobacter baumannii]HAV3998535.1 hypothetical protein [Acinetobacter baumannii]